MFDLSAPVRPRRGTHAEACREDIGGSQRRPAPPPPVPRATVAIVGPDEAGL
jgi:hypothetical protein